MAVEPDGMTMPDDQGEQAMEAQAFICEHAWEPNDCVPCLKSQVLALQARVDAAEKVCDAARFPLVVPAELVGAWLCAKSSSEAKR